jgi:hypothetical protein
MLINYTNSGVCAINHKIYLTVTRETIQMKASEVTELLMIPLHDFKVNNGLKELPICLKKG